MKQSILQYLPLNTMHLSGQNRLMQDKLMILFLVTTIYVVYSGSPTKIQSVYIIYILYI